MALPKGCPRSAARPRFPEEWHIGKPDMVISINENYAVPADRVIPYQKLRVENTAHIYGVDVKVQRKALPADAFSRLHIAYNEMGASRENAAYGWVRADD
jgi:hypothetical protein